MSIALNTLLLMLLSARDGHAMLGQTCESEYLEVSAKNAAGIDGCYQKSNHLTAHGRAVYTSKGGGIEGTTYGILGSLVGARLILRSVA